MKPMRRGHKNTPSCLVYFLSSNFFLSCPRDSPRIASGDGEASEVGSLGASDLRLHDFADEEREGEPEDIEGQPPVGPAVKAISLASIMQSVGVAEVKAVVHEAMETKADLIRIKDQIERMTGFVLTTTSAYNLKREHRGSVFFACLLLSLFLALSFILTLVLCVASPMASRSRTASLNARGGDWSSPPK
jgi:hypothetical protein